MLDAAQLPAVTAEVLSQHSIPAERSLDLLARPAADQGEGARATAGAANGTKGPARKAARGAAGRR